MRNPKEQFVVSPLLVIISGPPAVGKTELGRRLGRDLRLPFVHKDGIKETLFDNLGYSDREWSRRLGRATYSLLYYFAGTQLAAGNSLILESNFHAETATRELQDLRDRWPFRAVQIQCVASADVLIERWRRRALSGERHPGHVDHLCEDEVAPYLWRGRLDALDIGDEIIEVDTSDFDAVDYPSIVTTLRQQLEPGSLEVGSDGRH